MSPALILRRVRHLSTAAAPAVKPVTISHTKSKLKHVYDPDEAVKIYSSFTATNDPSSFPAATRFAQELAVRRLAKSHRFSDIQNLLESHKSLPQITSEPFLSSIIRSYGVVGMIEYALRTYNQMSDLGTPRSTLSFNTLLSACVRSKVFDRVPVYFNEFPSKFGFLPDKFSYGILIKSYCEMGSPEVAMEKLNEMEEKEIEISVVPFSTILNALYKKGRVDEAKKFWDDMVMDKGLSPDVGAYNVRLSHIHTGKPEDVKGLIEEMKNAGIKPDTISYNYLISCYCENGMMDDAKKVYDDLLKERGCNPNAATFRILLFNMCKHERYVTGYKVFKQSVKVHRIPDFNTLKYLVEGLTKKDRKIEAKAMVRTINKKFPPELLKAWGKLVEDLGLAPVDSEEIDSVEMEEGVDSGEMEEGVDSAETEKASTSV